MGVGENWALVGVGEGTGAGLGVGEGRLPAGAASFLSLRSVVPPVIAWRSSVWNVPVCGLKTSSLEKLGPTAPPAGAGRLLGRSSKVREGLLRVKPSSSSSKSKVPAAAAVGLEGAGLVGGRDTGLRAVGLAAGRRGAAAAALSAMLSRLFRADPPPPCWGLDAGRRFWTAGSRIAPV